MGALHLKLRRRSSALAVAFLLGGAAAAQAHVVFPSPGVMDVPNLPADVQAGHQFTLRELMPDGILGGVVHLQRRSPSGAWWTMTSGAVKPWVFWLHWHVPRAWAGSQIEVRFLLTDAGQTLAVSPDYPMSVTAGSK